MEKINASMIVLVTNGRHVSECKSAITVMLPSAKFVVSQCFENEDFQVPRAFHTKDWDFSQAIEAIFPFH